MSESSFQASASPITISQVHNDPELISQILHFLYQYEDFCMYLIGNLEKHGPASTHYPHSGDFFYIHSPNSILGVFCLCNTGVFLAYIPTNILSSDLVSLILSQIQTQKVPISGIIAEQSIAAKFISALKSEITEHLSIFSNSKSELLKISGLCSKNFEVFKENDAEDDIRCLGLGDFLMFKELIVEFEEAIHIQHQPEEMHKKVFEETAGLRQIWGYFKGNQLAAMVRLNSTTRTGGCFGGIYTKPEFRNRGLAKNLLKKALTDCRDVFNHSHNTLYTDEFNTPALKLYNSLGFSKIGQMQMIFFTINPIN